MVTMVIPWYFMVLFDSIAENHESTMEYHGVLWYIHGSTMVQYGTSVVSIVLSYSVWYFCGSTMVLQWKYRGSTVEVPLYHGTTIVLLWYYHGIYTMVNPWLKYCLHLSIYCTMEIPWYYHCKSTMVRPWYFFL